MLHAILKPRLHEGVTDGVDEPPSRLNALVTIAKFLSKTLSIGSTLFRIKSNSLDNSLEDFKNEVRFPVSCTKYLMKISLKTVEIKGVC